MSTLPAEELKEDIKNNHEEVDWFDVGAYEKRVVNFEKAYAIVLDKPFDPKYRMYAFGASALFKKRDGSFAEDYDERCPNLSLNAISILMENLEKNYCDFKIDVLNDLSELPFDAKLFYDNDETFEQVKVCPKIIVMFENQEISKIYTFKLETNLKYTNTLITFNNLLKQKRDELDRNVLIQNLFGALTQLNQQAHGPKKSAGGVIVPG